MLEETCHHLSWLGGDAVHEWVTDHGVQRRGSSPGLFNHRTLTLFLVSLLLHLCQSQEDLGESA